MTSFADLTTIGVGGPIATFLEPTTRVGVIEAVEEADSQGLPLCVIGGGSNMLVSDMPFEGEDAVDHIMHKYGISEAQSEANRTALRPMSP